MSKVNCDVAGLTFALTQIGERALRGISTVMEEEGAEIQALARSYAPVDEGDLESAIKLEKDRSGEHGRTRVFVYVDMDAPADHGKVVGDYAMLMHEGLAPYGSGAFHLGKLSIEKMMAGNNVGGKFMERAAIDRLPILMSRVQAIVKRALR